MSLFKAHRKQCRAQLERYSALKGVTAPTAIVWYHLRPLKPIKEGILTLLVGVG